MTIDEKTISSNELVSKMIGRERETVLPNFPDQVPRGIVDGILDRIEAANDDAGIPDVASFLEMFEMNPIGNRTLVIDGASDITDGGLPMSIPSMLEENGRVFILTGIDGYPDSDHLSGYRFRVTLTPGNGLGLGKIRKKTGRQWWEIISRLFRWMTGRVRNSPETKSDD